jgi:ABC-type dipeptide/oligopeptide/nickel transport system permease component
VKPYVRCGPYIIGCLTGYLLLEKDRPIFKLNTIQWILSWLFGIALGIYSVFGLWNYTKTGEISTAYSLTYTAIGRPCFALFMAWVVFACETDSNG